MRYFKINAFPTRTTPLYIAREHRKKQKNAFPTPSQAE